jgi:hypothetical protein
MDVSLPPAPYSLVKDIRATFLRVIAYMGALALVAIAAAAGVFRAPALIAGISSSSQPQWTTVDRPHPAFELGMPELAADAYAYTILRRPSDGARKDVLTWGAAAVPGPFVMVEIYRAGSGGEHFIDAESEIAARIVDFTVTDDVKPAGRVASKFGPVPLVDFAIAAHSRQRRCLGFARAFGQAEMQIAGWFCSPGDEVVDRQMLACALDRLTMLSAGGDSRLDALFARAEIKRTFCGRRDPILAATPERAAGDARLRNAKLRENIQLC